MSIFSLLFFNVSLRNGPPLGSTGGRRRLAVLGAKGPQDRQTKGRAPVAPALSLSKNLWRMEDRGPFRL